MSDGGQLQNKILFNMASSVLVQKTSLWPAEQSDVGHMLLVINRYYFNYLLVLWKGTLSKGPIYDVFKKARDFITTFL